MLDDYWLRPRVPASSGGAVEVGQPLSDASYTETEAKLFSVSEEWAITGHVLQFWLYSRLLRPARWL